MTRCNSIYCGRIFQNCETNINSFWLQAAIWATVRLLFLSLGDLIMGMSKNRFINIDIPAFDDAESNLRKCQGIRFQYALAGRTSLTREPLYDV